ncbi:MAG: recombination-associated protein RdgC [Succinivibrionaceae bacterium]|nr:recombination-associated protein RdgC [Ruminobacter sp.]MEE1340287.1 recombination-associated protein RdgC [Succinivibrionaceae bacterium]
MWFKNIKLFRLEETFNHSIDELERMLETHKFVPCKGQDIERMGWTDVLGKGSDALVHKIGDDLFFRCKIEKKMLPASVINDELAEKEENFELEHGRTLKKKEKSELKEQIITNLLPRAFSLFKETWIWINTKDNFLVVNAGSDKVSDDVISLLRKSLGSLPVQPFAFNKEITEVLTSWIQNGEAPQGFEIGSETELRDLEGDGAVIRAKKQDLSADEITVHIKAGKVVTSLALTVNDDISFVINENFNLKRIKLSDTLIDENITPDLDAHAQLDADLALMAGEYTKLLPILIEAFGGELEE